MKMSLRGSDWSLSSIVGVVFVILKLTQLITWPWLWVLAPFWIPLAVVLVVFGIAGFLFAGIWSGR